MRYNVPVTEARSTLSVDKVDGDYGDVTVFAVVGELDLATISLLKDVAGGALVEGGKPVVLDLSELSFCDSTGLGSFVALHRQAETVGATLSLVGPRKRVADLLHISGIDQVVPVYATVGEAAGA
jgi:anti-sigma B factor antagonist